jgi:hypothetical protein
LPPEITLIVRSLLLLALAYGLVARIKERRRRDHPLVGAPRAPTSRRLDWDLLLADVRELSSARFEGRRTGTDGGRLARGFIADRFAGLGLVPPAGSCLQTFSFGHTSIRALWQRDRPFRMPFSDAANVLGAITGRSRADRHFVVSAHYDHLGRRGGRLYPGADDNASGVAALLGMAAYFKEHPPEHSFLFAAFDAEELGRRGAQAFMAAPPVPVEGLALNVNMDMIGRGRRGRLLVSGTWHYPFLIPYLQGVAGQSGITLHLGHDRPAWRTGLVHDWTTSSDHAVFHARGIPFLYFGVDPHSDYHRPTDTFDRIPPGFYVQACEAVLETLLTLDREWDP